MPGHFYFAKLLPRSGRHLLLRSSGLLTRTLPLSGFRGTNIPSFSSSQKKLSTTQPVNQNKRYDSKALGDLESPGWRKFHDVMVWVTMGGMLWWAGKCYNFQRAIYEGRLVWVSGDSGHEPTNNDSTAADSKLRPASVATPYSST
jgi:hypothetical protein